MLSLFFAKVQAFNFALRRFLFKNYGAELVDFGAFRQPTVWWKPSFDAAVAKKFFLAFVGYGYPMQPRSVFSPFFRLFMVTKTPQCSNSFLGVFSGGLTVFPVVKYSFTAFRASWMRNFPSSKLNSKGKSRLLPYRVMHCLVAATRFGYKVFLLKLADLKFYCFFSYAFFGYY
jgi:hypothetical protein